MKNAKTNLFSHKSECCGCSLCAVVCPKGCISTVSDKMGFLYPQKDETQCTECGRCVSVCPQKN